MEMNEKIERAEKVMDMMGRLFKEIGPRIVESTLEKLPPDDRMMWENSLENLRKLCKKHKELVLGVHFFSDDLHSDLKD